MENDSQPATDAPAPTDAPVANVSAPADVPAEPSAPEAPAEPPEPEQTPEPGVPAEPEPPALAEEPASEPAPEQPSVEAAAPPEPLAPPAQQTLAKAEPARLIKQLSVGELEAELDNLTSADIGDWIFKHWESGDANVDLLAKALREERTFIFDVLKEHGVQFPPGV